MSEIKCLVDVMNVKAYPHHKRHSVPIDNRSIWRWYSRESRIYNSTLNKDDGTLVKGNLWFTNIIAFDFDIPDEVAGGQNLQNSFLFKLTNILGVPKFIIKNKNEYSDWQKEEYFTKYDNNGNKTIKLPKKYGCQVIYELNESIRSQQLEIVSLFNKVRLHITKLVDADTNFKCHMMKNWDNHSLFNVTYNKENNKVDLKELAFKYSNDIGLSCDDINKIFSLKDFETLNEKMPKSLIHASNILLKWYNGLNTWKGNKFNYKNTNNFNNCEKTFLHLGNSRNENLFNYLRLSDISFIENFIYNDYLNSSFLYENCDITYALEETEFDSTKASILSFLKENESYSVRNLSIIDDCSKVIKIDQNKIDYNFDKNVDINIFNYKFDIIANLVNLFMSNPLLYLSNIQSLMTPNFLTLINKTLFNNKGILYGEDSLFESIKYALYLTHFKYYNLIKRKKKVPNNKTSKFIRKKHNFKKMKKYGFFSFNKNNYNSYLYNLQKNGLLKFNGKFFAISFYQQYFHCKNYLISNWIKKLKNFTSNANNIINKFIIVKIMKNYNNYLTNNFININMRYNNTC